MAFDGHHITFSDPDVAHIPDIFARGALSLLALARGDTLDWLADVLRIRRSGGSCGLDVWLTRWMYFATGSEVGIRKLWDQVRLCSEQLGALVGGKKLVFPSSLSRALGSVEVDLLRPGADDLLLAPADCDKVLRHPAARTYDTRGEGWHCFDLDPTVTTLRHRAPLW